MEEEIKSLLEQLMAKMEANGGPLLIIAAIKTEGSPLAEYALGLQGNTDEIFNAFMEAAQQPTPGGRLITMICQTVVMAGKFN